MENRLHLLLILVFFSVFLPVPVWAGTAEDLFDASVLHDLHLAVDPGDWQRLMDSIEESNWYPATFEWRGQSADAQIRSRGSASRSRVKPALGVRFIGTFLGQKNIVLRNLVLDDSKMRERVVMEVFRAAGVPAPRVVHARLFVNGEYFGVYNMVEPVDEKAFVQSVFHEENGTVYSYKYSGDYRFEWLGNDPARYVPDMFRPRVNTNPDPMDLVNLLDAINNSTDQDFVTAISQHLNLEEFLRFIAIEILMNDWDNVTGEYGINNFDLYQHENSARFTFIPWDTKWTFIEPEDPIYKNWELSPLTRRIFTRPELWAKYLSVVDDVVRRWVNPEWLLPRINFIYDQIRAAAYEEIAMNPSTGQTTAAFEGWVDRLRQFAALRGANVLQQTAISLWDDPERYKVYFPLFVLGDNDIFGTGYATGLTLVNRTPGVANVAYKAYGMDGQLIAGPVRQEHEPAAQWALFEREIFGLDPSRPQVGWIEVSSNVDVRGFFLTADPNLASSINGSDVSAQTGRDLIFMQAAVTPARGINTYYAICNPNDQATRVRATFFGLSEPPQDFVIPAKGLKVIRLDPSRQVDSGYLRVVSDQPVTGTQLIGNAQSITILKPMPIPGGTGDLIFPHFAVNGGFTTGISIINPTLGRANLTIIALDDNGTMIGRRSQTLDPNQHLSISVGQLFNIAPSATITVGYLRVQSDVPGLIGFTKFDYADGRAVAAVPTATVPRRNLVFSHVVYNVPSGTGALYDTGVALVNPGNESTTYFLRLYDNRGNIIAQTQRGLGPETRESLLINEFFPEPLPAIAGGYISIRSEAPLYGFELFFTDSMDQLAAVPAQ